MKNIITLLPLRTSWSFSLKVNDPTVELKKLSSLLKLKMKIFTTLLSVM
jgi:hypothetical protein